MEYKFQEIAERIRELRKSKNLSQDGLIDLLSEHGLKIGRNTISSIENGVESAYTFAFLKTISKVFNCDIGYILGEYEEKTQEVHQMCLATGLSEKAIEKIQKISKKNLTKLYSIRRIDRHQLFIDQTLRLLHQQTKQVDYKSHISDN